MVKTLLSAAAVAALVGVGIFSNGGTVTKPASTEFASLEVVRPARGGIPHENIEVARIVRPHVARGDEGTPVTDRAPVSARVPRGGR